MRSLSTALIHAVESGRGSSGLYVAEVQLRSLLDQVTQRQKELSVGLVRKGLEFVPTVPLPPFALFGLADLYAVLEVSDPFPGSI